MREIKFRAWALSRKVMVDVLIINYKEMTVQLPIETDVNEANWWDETTWSFDEVKLMQYTGLKDKNGREIYEGDILRLKLDDYAGLEKPDIFLIDSDEVYYADVCYLQQIDDHIKQSETDDCIEIIGNIYENPELLAGDDI